MERNFGHLVVDFFIDKKHNKRKSAEAGTKIFDDVEKVRIRIAGDTKSVFVAPAHDQSSVFGPDNERLTYAELHAGPYEAFKRGQDAVIEGTPIGNLPMLTSAKEATLKAANIHTVEALADMDGSALTKLGMKSRDLKNQAVEYLEKQVSKAGSAELEQENEALKARLAALEAQMDGNEAQLADAVAVDDDDDDENPFADWDKDTIATWLEEQGGKYDARWSLERAQKAAHEHNKKLQEEAA
jgi:hypothetical protein